MEAADDEIEAVCSIWDGVKVEKLAAERLVTAKIRPLEDGSISASVLLECSVFEGYPTVNPRVKLTNPRGIGEPEFKKLCREIDEMVDGNSDGMPIICEIFQRCCDFLTEHQHVNMDCSICLLDLSDSPITVTSCEHFMHSACFCRYLNECARFIRKEIDDADLPVMKEKVDRNVLCPVCREILTEDDDDVDFEKRIAKIIANAKRNQKQLSKPKRRKSTTKEDVSRTIRSWREQQHRLAKIYEKQQKNGGIIDIEEDKKRRQFFIETGNQVGNSSEDPSLEDDMDDN